MHYTESVFAIYHGYKQVGQKGLTSDICQFNAMFDTEIQLNQYFSKNSSTKTEDYHLHEARILLQDYCVRLQWF